MRPTCPEIEVPVEVGGKREWKDPKDDKFEKCEREKKLVGKIAVRGF